MNEAIGLRGAGLGLGLEPGDLLLCRVGVLPGLGPVATIALLLPVTFSLPPTGALIMLAAI